MRLSNEQVKRTAHATIAAVIVAALVGAATIGMGVADVLNGDPRVEAVCPA